MGVVRIRHLSHGAGPEGVFVPGQIREMSQEQAAPFLAGGYAEIVTGAVAQELVDDEVKERKANAEKFNKENGLPAESDADPTKPQAQSARTKPGKPIG